MASLRARLIAGLLVLAALGLLLLGGITYAEQRSFLLDRVDQQARAATRVLSRVLDDRGLLPPGAVRGDRGGARRGGGPRDRPPGSPGPDGRSGPGGGGVDLPPGTYGERRDASGKVLGHVALSYGQHALPAPQLPARLTPDTLTTAEAQGDSGVRYRVLAAQDFEDPGVTIAAVPLREVDQTLHRLLAVEALVIGAVLLALGGLAWVLVRLGLRPLDRIAQTAGAIAAGELSRRVSPATSRTEVGRLGLALNAMLARLEQAFAERQASEERLRRFLADASHELRTPLASVRGYAELFRLGAASDPADTEKAMSRIEQEAARMGVLVEDLLTLARLDQVRDPVRQEVDLGALARDAVDDASATAPERRIELHADPSAVACGDPPLLRQVLGNLLRNALVHTPGGTPIEVTVGRHGEEVRMEVRDHGPGLPNTEPDVLFERFWRSEGGRERGRGGAGLGLAIVHAIVHAHDGTVRALNEPAGGARFVVSLPALAAPPAPQRAARSASV